MQYFFFLILTIAIQSCQTNSITLEPVIVFDAPQTLIETLPSAFEPFTPDELRQEWAKELLIANILATEQDYYRAITCFKRAKILISEKKYPQRSQQINYGIMLCYFFGHKYADVIEVFEKSNLRDVLLTFPASDDLLLMLYESYKAIDQMPKALEVLTLIEQRDPEKKKKIHLSEAVLNADLEYISCYKSQDLPFNTQEFLNSFSINSLSVRKAQTLNAVLPGAGYLYVGQKQAALTSFLINVLFIAAAAHFFQNGNIAAGVITSSLEAGWYFGGINGAGLAAKEYNERLYEAAGREFLIQNHIFPILMFQFSF